jgi:endonuclease-3 related protein
MKSPADRIAAAYDTLLAAYGPQGWWPSRSPFETMLGAVLTQHTSWRNAELALLALGARGLLGPAELARTPEGALASVIRASGSFRRKAGTIKGLANAIREGPGDVEGFLALGNDALRGALLGIRGIGPETADAIMLYAARRPVFVVDSYTRRYAERHGITVGRATYGEIQALFARALPSDAGMYAECHALLVRLGKEHCRAAMHCGGCPLALDLAEHQAGTRQTRPMKSSQKHAGGRGA